MDGDTEVIRNLLVPMGSAFNPCESGEAALLELSAGVVGRLPTGHVASLSTQIFAVINKRERKRRPTGQPEFQAACCIGGFWQLNLGGAEEAQQVA